MNAIQKFRCRFSTEAFNSVVIPTWISQRLQHNQNRCNSTFVAASTAKVPSADMLGGASLKNICPSNFLLKYRRQDAFSAVRHYVKSQQEYVPAVDLSFENPTETFRSKTDGEILRGLLVYKICTVDFLMTHHAKILAIMQALLPSILFKYFIRNSFYHQFVGAEDIVDLKATVDRNRRHGVNAILAYSVEMDIPQDLHENSKELNRSNSLKAHVQEMYKKSIYSAAEITDRTGFVAVKFSASTSPLLLLKISSILKHVHSVKETEHPSLFSDNVALHQKDYSWKQEFYSFVKQLSSHAATTEPRLPLLTDEEFEHFHFFLERADELARIATNKGVKLIIDAEQSYIQPCIARVAMELMRHYNKKEANIFNSYQCYLKETYDVLKTDILDSMDNDFVIGAKLVRGAYMDHERLRAAKMNYIDPINDDEMATSSAYNKSIDLLLRQSQEHTGKAIIMLATHNEESVRYAVKRMGHFGIMPTDPTISFGQLMGMCDEISYTLGQSGYNIYKYIPFGTLEEVLPYLSRRAMENKHIFMKAQKQKRLLKTEAKKRLVSLLPGLRQHQPSS